VELPEGKLTAIIVPGPCRFFGLWGRRDDYVIPWHCIRKMGPDIVLVDVRPDDCRTPRNKPGLLGGPYPLVQTGEVTAAELYITEYENTYTEEGLAQSKMWPKGTLCITIAANIAQTAILGFDSCFPDSVVGFIPYGQVTQIYMHYWFSFFQKILEEQAPQVAQKNINLKILSELDVMVPAMELQNQFDHIVHQLDKSKYVAYQLTLFLNKLIKYKLQSLFQEECICSLKM
jgi:type I restriction enzyme S subunit